MKVGTPQFVAARLREAKEARATTAVEIAERLGMSAQAISDYEHGRKTPSPETLRRLAEVLEVPSHYFLRPLPPEDPAVLFFRSLSSATKRDRARAARKYQWLREVVAYLHGLVEFPEVRFPKALETDDPREIRDDDVERAATEARREWGLADGPISNVAWLLENHGAVVARQQLDCEALDAFSQWNRVDATPYIVIGTEKLSAVRSRFNVSHELGHLILHRHVPLSTFNSPQLFKLIEEQANRFAGAFLMPAETFSASIYSITLDGFRAMKEQWKVAIGAMIVRATHLNLIGEAQASRLFMNRNRRGWRIFEPLDDVLPIEEPRFLRRAFDLLLDGGVASWQQMELQIARRISDIESVAGLPRGFLAREPDKVRLKPTLPAPSPYEWGEQQRDNWVLPFPKKAE